MRSPDILDALKSMADRCFNLPCHGSRRLQLCGATLSSPLTFFLAFRHVAEIFQESGWSNAFLFFFFTCYVVEGVFITTSV